MLTQQFYEDRLVNISFFDKIGDCHVGCASSQ
jgi:hypothetical protein